LSSKNVIRAIKSEEAARMAEMTAAYEILIGIRNGREQLGDLGVDVRIILESV
jgi:hypothetical protein